MPEDIVPWDYPELAMSSGPDARQPISRAEAHRRYRRRWHGVDQLDLSDHEVALIRSLEREFGEMPE